MLEASMDHEEKDACTASVSYLVNMHGLPKISKPPWHKGLQNEGFAPPCPGEPALAPVPPLGIVDTLSHASDEFPGVLP